MHSSPRTTPLLSLAIVIVLCGALFPTQTRASAEVIFSLIQTEGEKASDEFVELVNKSDESLALSGWSIRKKTKSDATDKGSSLKTFGANDIIPAQGYFLWANNGGLFKDFADTTTAGSVTDDNSLGLFDDTGMLVDAVTWGNAHVLPFGPKNFENPGEKERQLRDRSSGQWTLSPLARPTNSRGEVFEETPPPPPPESGPTTIRINEVFPNPKEKGDQGEFIELYNFGDADVDLSDWLLRDASATGKYLFPQGTKLAPDSYLVLTDADFTFSLNNSDETLSLYAASGMLIHSVTYEKTKDGVTLNWMNGKLRGGRAPTPGDSNSENTDPITQERVPKKGYKDVAVEFRARGSDTDGDQLKFTWDFGDGHKSYKEKTSHVYEKTGRYSITLSTDDGIDTAIESFEIVIKKYEYPKLRIVAFLPNPEGKDTENEWIEIENRGRKEVNLKDFGIATGAKKLTNHPVRDDLIIKAKDTKRLTRDDALFSFPNKKGKVELRAPDGKVLQKLKYRFDESLDEGIVLRKEKGKTLSIENIVSPTDDADAEIVSNNSLPAPENTEIPEAISNDQFDETAPLKDPGTKSDAAVLGETTEIPSPNKKERWALPSRFLSFFERANARLNRLLWNSD